MYLPLNPDKIAHCWDKFSQSLLDNKFSCSIHNGLDFRANEVNQNPRININDLVEQLKKGDYVRLGSRKMIFSPPHFSLKFLNNKKAVLSELISADDFKNTLKNDLILVTQLAFFENDGLNELIIPMVVEGVIDQGVAVEVSEKKDAMIISRAW